MVSPYLSPLVQVDAPASRVTRCASAEARCRVLAVSDGEFKFWLWVIGLIVLAGLWLSFKFLRWFWREMMTIREIELDENGNRKR